MKKDALPKLFDLLARERDLYIPARMDDNQDSVRFVQYSGGMQPDLTRQPFMPAKELFFGKREVLVTWDGKRFGAPQQEVRQKAIFGMRRCDLNAVRKQDIAFSRDFDDLYYKRRREGSLLIGYHCDDAPTENCFCSSLPKRDFFDLMLYDRGSSYLVEVGSGAGAAFVKGARALFGKSEARITDNDRRIRGLRKLDYSGIRGSDGHKAWDSCVAKCLSCSACTAWCPTCYCHEISDSVDSLDMESGERVRTWSSCQLESFTRVAGGTVFRKGRRERYLHRVMHQLLYFGEKNGEPLCVGCGRCITHCPTRIDFVGALNDISSTGGGMR